MAFLITDPAAASRLARAIASDLSLYNEDKVKQGRRDGTLFELMRDEIDEGRQLWVSRVAPELVAAEIYEREVRAILLPG